MSASSRSSTAISSSPRISAGTSPAVPSPNRTSDRRKTGAGKSSCRAKIDGGVPDHLRQAVARAQQHGDVHVVLPLRAVEDGLGLGPGKVVDRGDHQPVPGDERRFSDNLEVQAAIERQLDAARFDDREIVVAHLDHLQAAEPAQPVEKLASRERVVREEVEVDRLAVGQAEGDRRFRRRARRAPGCRPSSATGSPVRRRGSTGPGRDPGDRRSGSAGTECSSADPPRRRRSVAREIEHESPVVAGSCVKNGCGCVSDCRSHRCPPVSGFDVKDVIRGAACQHASDEGGGA